MVTNKMRYVIGIDTPAEVAEAVMKNPEESLKGMKELMAKYKPEAMYFSTTRRFSVTVVNVEDPHVELRRLIEALSKFGSVTVDPVSTFEEMEKFIRSYKP